MTNKPTTSNGIPEDMPSNALKKREATHLEGIGQPTLPGFFTMSNIDPAHWYTTLHTLLSRAHISVLP